MKGEAREKRKARVKAEKKEEVKEKELIFGLSEKQILLFLLEFLAVSAVFLGVWYYIGEFYQGAVFFFAEHILLAMGYTLAQISAVNLSGAFSKFQFGALSGVGDSDPGVEIEGKGRDACHRHTNFASFARSGYRCASSLLLRNAHVKSGICYPDSGFNRSWRRSDAVYYMVRIRFFL